jgi:prevent-host-death family protein
MLTMTSLVAQNQFGALIDASQRMPVIITRHGRPVSVVTSYQDAQTIPFHIAQMISENYPLQGKAAGDAMRSTLSQMSDLAEREGLTEADISRIVYEG